MLTLALIVLTCVVSFAAFNSPRMIEKLILWPPAVKRGEWWRLGTYGLIHADVGHLAFNMITLYFFGRVIEPFLVGEVGQAGYVGFYVAALVFSILPTYATNRDNAEYRSLGASGAVSAVLFAFILTNPWSMLLVFFIPMPAIVYAVAYTAYSIWMDRARKDNVNHSAHLWGAAFGVAFMLVVEPRVWRVFLTRLLDPSFG